MKRVLKLSSLLLVLLACLTLSSCVPSADKAEEKMEEAGYVAIDSSKIFKSDESKVEKVFYFAKGDNGLEAAANVLTGGDWVLAIYYKETADAKEAYNEYKESSDEEESAVKRSGKCIYYGTEGGMKDFN